MKKEYVSAEVGSVAVQIGDNTILIPNGLGDGSYKVYEMTNEEFNEYCKDHEKYELKYNWLTRCKFSDAMVMYYDCYEDKDNVKENSVFILNGTYDIYNNYGKVYFIKLNR